LHDSSASWLSFISPLRHSPRNRVNSRCSLCDVFGRASASDDRSWSTKSARVSRRTRDGTRMSACGTTAQQA
jgi:hypothetical protein